MLCTGHRATDTVVMMLSIQSFDVTARHLCVVRRSPEIDRNSSTVCVCGARLASGPAASVAERGGRRVVTTLPTFNLYNRFRMSAINRCSGYRTVAIGFRNKPNGRRTGHDDDHVYRV